MAFKVKLLISARKDLEDAVEYYHKINPVLAKRFYDEFIELNLLLEKNPFFEIKYNFIRTYKLRSFPYLVHFLINEKSNLGMILAIVFGWRGKTNFEDRLSDL